MPPQIGFGNSPGPYGDQGVPPAQPPDEQAQHQAEDIHAIKNKYVGPGLSAETFEDVQLFNLAPGQVQKVFDDPNLIINAIIVTCESGTVRVWLKDQGAPLNVAVPSVRANDQSNIIVPSGGASPEYMLSPVKGRPISVGNPSTAAVNAVGCVVLVRV